jgi:hypothetical protein
VSILVVSASLGDFDKQQNHEKQSVACDFYQATDENFPPRFNSMTPRLQARIPKMTSWQMRPGYDYYLWIDSSCRLASTNSVQWFLDQLGEADIAVFKHPHRKTVQEEADYLKHRLAIKCPYITPRYENERIDDQLTVVDPSAELYASTAFIYRDDTPARDLLTLWWLHTSLYHSIDQLSLPKAIADSGATVKVIPDNYLKCEALEYVRNR